MLLGAEEFKRVFVQIAEDNASPRFHDACHFPNGVRGRLHMVEKHVRKRGIDGRISDGKRAIFADPAIDGSAVPDSRAQRKQHFFRLIDSNNMMPPRQKFFRDES